MNQRKLIIRETDDTESWMIKAIAFREWVACPLGICKKALSQLKDTFSDNYRARVLECKLVDAVETEITWYANITTGAASQQLTIYSFMILQIINCKNILVTYKSRVDDLVVIMV